MFLNFFFQIRCFCDLSLYFICLILRWDARDISSIFLTHLCTNCSAQAENVVSCCERHFEGVQQSVLLRSYHPRWKAKLQRTVNIKFEQISHLNKSWFPAGSNKEAFGRIETHTGLNSFPLHDINKVTCCRLSVETALFSIANSSLVIPPENVQWHSSYTPTHALKIGYCHFYIQPAWAQKKLLAFIES